jgi:8-oxo-dGTP diphosphatase
MALAGYLKDLRELVGHRPVLLPAACALIFNDRDELLLHRASDDGRWHTTGGTIEPGEEPATAAIREAREETGLEVVAERLVGVYAWPRVSYPNGDECD